MVTIVIISLSQDLLMISFIYVWIILCVYVNLSWFCSLFNSCFPSQYQGHFFLKAPGARESVCVILFYVIRESVERENRIININGDLNWSWFNTWALCWFCGFEFITANKRIKGHLGEISCFYCKYIMITIVCTPSSLSLYYLPIHWFRLASRDLYTFGKPHNHPRPERARPEPIILGLDAAFIADRGISRYFRHGTHIDTDGSIIYSQ